MHTPTTISCIALVALGMLLAGCMSNREFAQQMTARAKDPAERSALTVECLADTKRRLSHDELEGMAAMMGVKLSRVPWTMCDRLVTALAVGDLTEAEYVEVLGGRMSGRTGGRLIKAMTTPGFSEPARKATTTSASR